MHRIHPLMADVIHANFGGLGPIEPIDLPEYRTDAQRIDVALMAATSVMRQRLEVETGDKLDEAIALRIMAAATAAFSAAMAAQRGGTR